MIKQTAFILQKKRVKSESELLFETCWMSKSSNLKNLLAIKIKHFRVE